MIMKCSVNEILTRLQIAAKKNATRLTFSNSKVYLKMLDFACDSINSITSSKGVRFNCTTLELAEYCSVSPRIITESLHKFAKCGIIKYTINTPNPSIVLMYKEFYSKGD